MQSLGVAPTLLRMPSQNPRIALTVPPELDAVLGRIAAATGTGKATFVREWLCEAMPQLAGLATAMEMAKNQNTEAFTVLAQVLREATGKADQAALDLKVKRRKFMRKRPRD